MIFPKSYKNKAGMILVDIVVALSLVVIFSAVLLESTSISRTLFDRSRERDRLLDIYEAHRAEFQGFYPYDSKNVVFSESGKDVPVQVSGNWYGNDRIETTISLADTITLNSVRSYPFDHPAEGVSTPLCTVEYHRHGQISVTPIMLPVDPLLPLTDIEVRNNTVYLSADSSRVIDPDFLVIDIHDHENPILKKEIHSGPGIASITISGKRIFAAAVSTAAQVHVFKADAPYEFSLEAMYTLPLPATTTPPSRGSAIFSNGNYVYVGTEKWDGFEFSIYEISENGIWVLKGGLEIGSKVTDIFVRNMKAYITSAAEDQFIIADVSDALNPSIIETFSPSGWDRQEGKRFSFFEDSLGFGRTTGGFDIRTDHELFSWGTSSVETLGNPLSRNMLGGVYGLVADRSYLYLATREAGHELQILKRDLSARIASYSVPVAPHALTCDNDTLYLLAVSAPVIYEISFK